MALERDTTISFDPTPLKLARRSKGWNLARLARASGCSIATCSRVLAGKTAQTQTVAEIANALGVAVSECYSAIRNPQSEMPPNPDPDGPGPRGRDDSDVDRDVQDRGDSCQQPARPPLRLAETSTPAPAGGPAGARARGRGRLPGSFSRACPPAADRRGYRKAVGQ
jgi:transcriptional regulator with XRE-family HTH domain